MIKNISDIKHIYYINLNSREDRRKHIEKQLEKVGLNAHRFPAIKHNVGTLGCSLSHLTLLKYAKYNNLDHILILEDDVLFMDPTLFVNNLNTFLSHKIDYDVLLLAGNNMGQYTKINDHCVKITNCYTTTAYLVKENYYDKLIDNIEQGIKLLISNTEKSNLYTIDSYWSNLQIKDNWLLLTPLSIIQKPDISDIEGKYTDYSNVMLSLNKFPKYSARNTINKIYMEYR